MPSRPLDTCSIQALYLGGDRLVIRASEDVFTRDPFPAQLNVTSIDAPMPLLRLLEFLSLMDHHRRTPSVANVERFIFVWASIEEDIKDMPIERLRLIWELGGYEADTSAGDTIEVGINPMSAPIVEEVIVEPAGEDPSDSSGTTDGIVRSFKDLPIDLDDVVRDFYHHMSEVHIDRIIGIETCR
ncbi:hypothetical protein Tco_0506819 [Tanacetum coccineum]